MSSTNDITVCANCGKGEESSNDLKACTACKLVKYCNRDCQIAHRPQHKKACKKRAAELYDEMLFTEHPPREECPICFLPLPFDTTQTTFQTCCGKTICNGCIYTMITEDTKRGKKNKEINACAFCRTLRPSSDEEEVKRLKKQIEKGNGQATNGLAILYDQGTLGVQRDVTKANELLHKAGELGYAPAYYNLGYSYHFGDGVEIDKKKAKHFYELAAIKGGVYARHNLGILEGQTGNEQRAYKHMIIAAKAGNKKSLDTVKKGFTVGIVTKDEYEQTLRSYHKCLDETKSDMRDKAAASAIFPNNRPH